MPAGLSVPCARAAKSPLTRAGRGAISRFDAQGVGNAGGVRRKPDRPTLKNRTAPATVAGEPIVQISLGSPGKAERKR